jgi:hypothetical protein
MLIETLAPICISGLLFLFFLVHISVIQRKHRKDREDRQRERERTTGIEDNPQEPKLIRVAEDAHANFKQDRERSEVVSRYLSLFFLIIYLVLPSVTTSIAGVIPTRNLDPENIFPGSDRRYMVHDLAISATSPRYKFGYAWASVMAVVYPVGVPVLYYCVLSLNKHEIMTGQRRHSIMYSDIKRLRHYITPETIRFLHGAYEGTYWYWEIIETIRRLLLTAVVSVVSTGTYSTLQTSFCGLFLSFDNGVSIMNGLTHNIRLPAPDRLRYFRFCRLHESIRIFRAVQNGRG